MQQLPAEASAPHISFFRLDWLILMAGVVTLLFGALAIFGASSPPPETGLPSLMPVIVNPLAPAQG